MHQELDAYRLSCIRPHVHRLLYPGLIVTALMEDRLQEGAIAIGDVGILPVDVMKSKVQVQYQKPNVPPPAGTVNC